MTTKPRPAPRRRGFFTPRPSASPTTPSSARSAAGNILARQELINRPRAPIFTFYLHENVLRIPIGGPAIMSDQLHYLLRMSVRTNVTIRVVPARAGAYAGMSGPFTLMEARDFKPIVYLNNETTSLFLETPTETDAYRNILDSLDDAALNAQHTRELITKIAQIFAEANGSVTGGHGTPSRLPNGVSGRV